MFIFIGGITPKTRKLDDTPRRCPYCGLYQAYQMRVDHYLNLFFIPVLRVKKGKTVIMCEQCHKTTSEFGRDFSPHRKNTRLFCKFCGNAINKEFFYCPFCGKKR